MRWSRSRVNAVEKGSNVFPALLPESSVATGTTMKVLHFRRTHTSTVLSVGRERILITLLAVAVVPTALSAQGDVPIIVSAKATAVEKLAATELSRHLQLLYPQVRFAVAGTPGAHKRAVLVGTVASSPELARYVDTGSLKTPESFIVTNRASTAIIAGADPRGVLYGVYGLLEKLGFSYYLSYTARPPAQSGPFSFAGWDLADSPLVATRIVFNWHNFLSGCSTWDLADWQNWIVQSSRMRFNGIMVHAYGNNPMFAFTHNGLEKPTGYLSTTARGRDWGTEHVLEVRGMIGAAGLFDSPVFGSSAAMVPEGQTHQAATELMQKVFQFAAEHGMGVTFAFNVDTVPANPQNIIATLPASVRFAAGGIQVVNPETPEGYAYYRSQIEQLLQTYPQITQLAVWFRGEKTSPWRGLKPENFPRNWRQEYERAIQSRPDLQGNGDSPSMFAIGKIAAAFRQILDKSGHKDVLLAAGSWRFEFLAAADAFMPRNVTVIPLDYSYEFPSDPVQEGLRRLNRHRPVIPVVWAQHDDRSYVGRPYLPFAGFASILRSSGSPGYGIIHWTTRPLDLYFKSLADQVWSASENETLDTTCERMAERTFGAAARVTATRYLLAWIQGAPQFGRETTNRFMDQHLQEAPVLEGCNRRLQILRTLERQAESPQANTWVRYFENWEQFVQTFYAAQGALQRSLEASEGGDPEGARREISAARPEAAIEQYARTIIQGGASRGEKGILVSLNLRWLPYFAAQREVLGMEPLRVRFAPTAPEALAQAPGLFTYAFDANQRLWLVLGSAETGGDVQASGANTPCSGGLKVDQAISLTLSGMGGRPLPSGPVRVSLEVPPGASVDASGVQVKAGELNMTLKPVNGPASVCGLSIDMSGRPAANHPAMQDTQ